MTSVLRDLLTKEFPIEITPSHIRAIEGFKFGWEHKGTNWSSLNTPYLGVTKISFTDMDQNSFFDIFHINREEFKRIYHQSKAVFYIKYNSAEDIVGKEQLKKVGSDPMNGFIVYLSHLIANSDLPEVMKSSGIGNIYSLMIYKFFTSVLSNSFTHPANEDVMKYTIEHLSAMFTIRQEDTNTWYLLFKEKAFEIYKPKMLHYDTIRLFNDDEKIIYIITDTQTKIRKFLVNVIKAYYDNYNENNRIISSSAISMVDGSKILQSTGMSYQNIISNVIGDAININRFIDRNLISLTINLNKKLKMDVVTKMFTAFSTIAAEQYKQGKADQVLTHGDSTLYVGYKALLTAIVQKSFRLCVVDGVNMKSGKDILIKIKNTFTSSKIDNRDVEDIKNSVSKFIEDNNITTNIALIPALRISFVLYVILLSFKYL